MINSVEVHNGEHTDCYIISTNGRLELYASIEGEGFGGRDELVSRDAMQFTGLTDKNGKDIYEGDICSYHNQRPEVVHFDQHGATTDTLTITEYWTNGVEVIGNIHQHSHLLDKGE